MEAERQLRTKPAMAAAMQPRPVRPSTKHWAHAIPGTETIFPGSQDDNCICPG